MTKRSRRWWSRKFARPEAASTALICPWSATTAWVLLVGQVSSEQLRAQAGEITQNIPRVRRVHNELEVGGPISYMARTNDGVLTSKVKSKLVGAKGVPGRKIKVQTENGVVYLMGMVTREEADQAVESAKTAYGVQKIVRVFEYLD